MKLASARVGGGAADFYATIELKRYTIQQGRSADFPVMTYGAYGAFNDRRGNDINRDRLGGGVSCRGMGDLDGDASGGAENVNQALVGGGGEGLTFHCDRNYFLRRA